MQILHGHTCTHTHCKHIHTRCLSSVARHGHGDPDRFLAEHPPGYRIVCPSFPPLPLFVYLQLSHSALLNPSFSVMYVLSSLWVHRSNRRTDRETQTDRVWKLPSRWLISSLAGRDASDGSSSQR